jgi:hypothetical protein
MNYNQLIQSVLYSAAKRYNILWKIKQKY